MLEERRGAVRKPVDLPIECRVPATYCRAVMCDVSTSGCRLEAEHPLLRGTTVLIKLLDRTEAAGTVFWSRGRTVGVHFLVPLSAALVDLLASAGSQGVDVLTA